jgi:type II secretory pathway pseudopilin PulG
MSASEQPASTQRGDTLVELLVAVAILGIAVVALVGGIGTSILVSDVHRKDATAEAVVRSYAESIQSGVALDDALSTYVDCGTAGAYAAPPGFSVPHGYTASVTGVQYWTGTAFASAGHACSTRADTDTGIQRLTLRVSSTDTNAVETLDVIIRKPCRQSDEACTPASQSLAR